MGLLILDNWTNLNFHTIYESNIYTVYITSETDFHIFVGGGGVATPGKAKEKV